MYIQAQRKFGEKLKFTGSLRYDGAQNYDANYSPRASFVWTPDEARKHNFRVSYQTGFRYPTTQNQYIGLETPIGILLGSASDNYARYSTTRPRSVSVDQNILDAFGVKTYNTLTGVDIKDNSFTAASAGAFAASAAQGVINPSLLVKANVSDVMPEKVTAYEFGYRGS